MKHGRANACLGFWPVASRIFRPDGLSWPVEFTPPDFNNYLLDEHGHWFNYRLHDRYKTFCVELSFIRYQFGNSGGVKMGYDCCGGQRSFLTKEEKIELLKEYQENISKELQGIKE